MKPAKNLSHPIHPLLNERYSPRAFKLQEIPEAELYSLIEAARWSPSSMNEQPWQFIIGNQFKNKEVWKKIYSTLSPFNQPWAKNAPILLMAIARKNFARNNEPNAWAEYDLGQSIAYLTIQAQSMGISMHQMGGFNADMASMLFGISKDKRVVTISALGYADSEDTLPEDLKQRELAIQVRKPIEELILAPST